MPQVSGNAEQEITVQKMKPNRHGGYPSRTRTEHKNLFLSVH